MMVSVVLPVHNERPSLAPLMEELMAALGSTRYEVIAVDVGSSDGSLAELSRLRSRCKTLRVLALARRSGQSAAIAAGVDAACGDVVVTMDADGQNDPADVPVLLALLDDGCTAVVGYRPERADTRWKRVQSGIANGVRNWLTGDRIRDTGCSLRVIRRGALATIPRFNGMHRFLPTLIRLQGGRDIEAPVSHRPRRFGRSHYRMLNRALVGLGDALGVRWLVRRALRYDVREDR